MSAIAAGQRSIAELLRTQAQESPNAPYIAYPDAKFHYEVYSISDIDRLSSHVALQYSKVLPQRESSASPRRVIAILGASNLEYLVTIFALQKLGFEVLLLSTRISDGAYRHLFEKTGSRHILVQPAYDATIARVKASFPEEINVIRMAAAPAVKEVSPEADVFARELAERFDPDEERDKTAFIIHSSGSTGLPKPIGQSHTAVLNTASSLVGMSERNDGYVTLPFFHSFGTFAIMSALLGQTRITLHNAELPLTAQNMLQPFRNGTQKVFYAVPYALKLFSELEEGMEYMKNCDLVVSGGSSCPEELGNRLVENGVKLSSIYGSTEAGGLMSSTRDYSADKEWSWLKIIPKFKPYAEWSHAGDNIYELVVLPGWPSKVYTNRDDGAYLTRDLFQQHPTNPEKWRFLGRRDDTLILVNGENANPIPLELAVRQAPLVHEVVVAGAERATLSMIIIPTKDMPREEFIDQIWSFVEIGNEQVPAFSKISREAILILPAGTNYPRTDKRTPIRQAFYNTFSKEIDNLYVELESITNDPNAGLKLSKDETREFIRNTMFAVLDLEDPSEFNDDADVFNLGLDSLQALTLWRKITRELNTGGHKVGQNIAFDKPTVRKLANYLYGLRTGESEEEATATEKMQALLEKYSNFTRHTPGNVQVDGEYIVLTGATGSLGAHLVAQLAARDSVRKIYCLNRASSLEKAQERTIASLKKRQLYDRLSPEQLGKVVSYPADLSQETLGLSSEDFAEVVEKATSVIHCAWQVNFNMDVMSFESHHIRGAYNLISICLKSPHATPPSFNFCSSVSTVLGTPASEIPEALPTSFDFALPMGYARSKLVTEYMCAAAAKKTGIAARVCRIGQVVGDTVNGIWNATEAIPLTVQSATTIGKLPVVPGDEEISWLPVDVVAATVIECSLLDKLDEGTSPPSLDAVFAVQHPKYISWNNDFLPALKEAGLQFEGVDQRDWVKALESSPQDPKSNPPVKLMEFFKGRYNKDSGDKQPFFHSEQVCKYSPSLRNCQVPDATLLKKFLAYWQEKAW